MYRFLNSEFYPSNEFPFPITFDIYVKDYSNYFYKYSIFLHIVFDINGIVTKKELYTV